MSISEKIKSFIKNKRMSIEEKIIYLTYLYEEGIDFSLISNDYVSKDKVIVKSVIHNIQYLYNKNKLSVKQILDCEKIGIEFEPKDKINEKIEFLQKAKDEGISLFDIINNFNEYSDKLIFKYICDLREDFERKNLNETQIYKCKTELKIILSEEEKKKIILEKIKESALRNIIFSNEIKEILSAH